MILKFTTGNRY